MENKIYSFSTNDAMSHGVDAAILIHNIRYWLDHARANDQMEQDGYHWMFMSANKMQSIMPFWSQEKIRRLLKGLEESGVVITGEYNKSSWDRTRWYSMPEFHSTKMTHRGGENDESTFHKIATSHYGKKEDSNICNSETLNYSEIESIYNESLPLASNIAKMTPARKKHVKKFFDEFGLDSDMFKNYLEYMAQSPECQWMFERRPKNDGSGQFWAKSKFEYFLSEKCYLNVKENI